jgi:hypothetical protein
MGPIDGHPGVPLLKGKVRLGSELVFVDRVEWTFVPQKGSPAPICLTPMTRLSELSPGMNRDGQKSSGRLRCALSLP